MEGASAGVSGGATVASPSLTAALAACSAAVSAFADSTAAWPAFIAAALSAAGVSGGRRRTETPSVAQAVRSNRVRATRRLRGLTAPAPASGRPTYLTCRRPGAGRPDFPGGHHDHTRRSGYPAWCATTLTPIYPVSDHRCW